MIYLLDTNACIEFLRGKNLHLLNRLEAAQPGDVCLCSIVLFELQFGALRSRNPETALSAVRSFSEQYPSLPFDDDTAAIAARIRAGLAESGVPIGPFDTLIAATALAHGLTLVTHNTREFTRVPSLLLEGWEA